MRAALASLLLLSACSLTGTQSPQALQSLSSGAYQLAKDHGSIIVRVKHMGLSNYTMRFTDFDATLDFDPKNPAASHVKANVNPLSVRAEHPTDAGWDMTERLMKEEGLALGHSSGAAAAGALTIARRLVERKEQGTIVTVFPDRADRYFEPRRWEKSFAWP